MLPHTRAFTRDGCIVGARLVTYAQLVQWYVCNDCGGAVVHQGRWSEEQDKSIDWAECSQCEGRDFVSAHLYEKRAADALVPEPSERSVSARRAIAELYDL